VALHRVKTLALDEASRTSAALAKILIARVSGQVPRCASFSPLSTSLPDTDALLVIGDPAFTFTRPGFERLDLGRAWRLQQSLPFVFAVMVAGTRAKGSGISARISEATRRGLEAASTIARSYNSGVDAVRAERYLRSVIRYDLGPREKEGFALFCRLAEANGLLARMKELEFHAI
jgi:chorismate dehydratase